MNESGLRILVLIHNQSSTGPFQTVLEMCQALSSSGHHVTLVSTSPNRRFFGREWASDERLLVLESPDLLFGKLRQGVDMWNAFRRVSSVLGRHYDVIHAIDCRPNVIFPALILRKMKKIPLVISWWDQFGHGGAAVERSGKFYGQTFGHIETFFEEKFRKYADRATVISYRLKSRLESLGYPPGNISVIRVGCDVENYKRIDRQAARKQMGLDEKEKILCYAGNIFSSDMSFLLLSLKELSKRREMPLTILIGEHKIPHDLIGDLRIEVTGRLKEYEAVHNYLCASDFGLLPFRVTEANMSRWPSKISSYLTAGLPMITTPISDLPDFFERRALGHISSDDTVESFAQTMDRALSTKSHLHEQMSREARNLAENELGWGSIAKALQHTYESAMTK